MSKELEARMVEYRREVRKLWFKQVPVMALLSALVVFGLAWMLSSGGSEEPGSLDWRLKAFCLWGVMMIPPIWMFYPDRPTEEDIDLDRMLNKIGQIGRQMSARQNLRR